MKRLTDIIGLLALFIVMIGVGITAVRPNGNSDFQSNLPSLAETPTKFFSTNWTYCRVPLISAGIMDE